MSVLRRRVLVLNKQWMACGIVTVRRAVALLYKDEAEVVDPFRQYQTFYWDEWIEQECTEQECLTTAKMRIRVPEVIVLSVYGGLPTKRINFSKRSLFRRDNHTCQYCGERLGSSACTVDHVTPRYLGGKTSWENCVTACHHCNSRKANKLPEQAGMRFYRSGFKPFKPKFSLFKSDAHNPAWIPFLNDLE